jgi:stage II sporulation protein D (peptidoglycan lytic transglycosylase)
VTRAVLALAVVAWALPARAVEVVRIAVVIGAPRVDLSAPGLAVAPAGSDAAPAHLGDRAEVARAGDALVVNGVRRDAPALLFTAPAPIRVGAHLLAGEVEVRRGQAAGLDVVHAIPMEDYVAAVTGSEMPASFPPEALRAQAVAARTFAIHRKLEAVAEGRPWHVGATVLDQVYRAAPVDPRARAAAEATAGLVLAHDHVPVEAYFHAACGGRTERGAEALGRDLPYLQSVACDRCRGAPRARWTVRVGGAELGRVVALGAPATGARVLTRTSSGRAERVEVSARGRKVALGAGDLRQRLGFARLPSLLFDVRAAGGEVVFEGRGAGHGAGLCQWGAAGFAREGATFRDILARYYPGTELLRMY